MRAKLIIGQSGGPTQVINASLAGILTAAKQGANSISIIGMAHGIEGILNNCFYDLSKLTNQEIEIIKNTPSSWLGSCRYKLKDEDYELILRRLMELNVTRFIYIGGNDSMDTCNRISALAKVYSYDLQVLGIPKTIDNDLVITDHSPGFGSAAKFIALCTHDAGLDLEAMSTFDDVTILEVMGRNTGWLAAAAVLAKQNEDDSPHLIYMPEVDFSDDQFLNDVTLIHNRLGRVFVVACEGIHYSDGRAVGVDKTSEENTDAFGHQLLALTSGVASYLSDLVAKKLKLRSRFLRPGLIGRALSACVSNIDRQEAYLAGIRATQLLNDGKSNLMVTIERYSNFPYEYGFGCVPLIEVANHEKPVPGEYISQQGNMVTKDFVNYALPLIDGALAKVVRIERRFEFQPNRRSTNV